MSTTTPQRALIGVARELLGMTLDELAAAMGYTKPVSVRWLAAVEAGEFAVSRHQINDLSTRVARILAAA